MNIFWSFFRRTQGIFFDLLYTRLARGYDLVAWVVSAGRWHQWAAMSQEFIQSSSILELGHGTGHLILELTKNGKEVVGLDRSRQMGRIARNRLLKNHHPARLVNAETQALPFAGESWDCVCASFPTNFIFEEPGLLEIKRVLRPNGQLLVLLSAWPGKRSLGSRAANLIYRTTGQISPDHLQTSLVAERYEKFGFSVQIEWRENQGDQLLFFIAKKPV